MREKINILSSRDNNREEDRPKQDVKKVKKREKEKEIISDDQSIVNNPVMIGKHSFFYVDDNGLDELIILGNI